MDVELLSQFSGLPLSLRMAISESKLPCILKVNERKTTRDQKPELSSQPKKDELPKNAVIKIEKETNLQLVQICAKRETDRRTDLYIPVGYKNSLIHQSSKLKKKSYGTVAEIGEALPLCVNVDCDLTSTMMTGRKIQLTKGTQLWPLHIVKDISNNELFLSCFTGNNIISLPFSCVGIFEASSVYLRDLENSKLPKIVQMEHQIEFSDILSESKNEEEFLMDIMTTPIEILSFKTISVYVGFVTQVDTLNGKHIIIIPCDFQQLDSELVNLLTSSSSSLLKEMNDSFFSWTVGMDLECIHEKLFCVDNDPGFIYLKYFPQNDEYTSMAQGYVASNGSELALPKVTSTSMYANDLQLQIKNKENIVAGEKSDAGRISPVPDLPPRKPRKDDADYLIPIASKKISDRSLNLWQMSGHSSLQKTRVESEDVTQDEKTFFDYSVDEVSTCFRQCALDKVGDICFREKLDGRFFKHLTTKVFEEEPFCLSPFEIRKLISIVVDGWRPK